MPTLAEAVDTHLALPDWKDAATDPVRLANGRDKAFDYALATVPGLKETYDGYDDDGKQQVLNAFRTRLEEKRPDLFRVTVTPATTKTVETGAAGMPDTPGSVTMDVPAKTRSLQSPEIEAHISAWKQGKWAPTFNAKEPEVMLHWLALLGEAVPEKLPDLEKLARPVARQSAIDLGLKVDSATATGAAAEGGTRYLKKFGDIAKNLLSNIGEGALASTDRPGTGKQAQALRQERLAKEGLDASLLALADQSGEGAGEVMASLIALLSGEGALASAFPKTLLGGIARTGTASAAVSPDGKPDPVLMTLSGVGGLTGQALQKAGIGSASWQGILAGSGTQALAGGTLAAAGAPIALTGSDPNDPTRAAAENALISFAFGLFQRRAAVGQVVSEMRTRFPEFTQGLKDSEVFARAEAAWEAGRTRQAATPPSDQPAPRVLTVEPRPAPRNVTPAPAPEPAGPASVYSPDAAPTATADPLPPAPVKPAPAPAVDLPAPASQPPVDVAQAPVVKESLTTAPVQDASAFLGYIKDSEALAKSELPPGEFPVIRLRPEKLLVNKDLPQFKRDADRITGEVKKIKGPWDDTLGGNIIVWERTNGDLEVATGRHRLALAKRLDRESIRAQIMRERDGYGRDEMMALDARNNIREGQGTISDYVSYFLYDQSLDTAKAESLGLFRNSTADKAWHIAKGGSVSLRDLWENGKLSDDRAAAIAAAAPGDEGVQVAAVKKAIGPGRLPPEQLRFYTASLRQLMANRRAMEGTGSGDQLLLLGDDFAQIEAQAEQLSAAQADLVDEVSQQLKAIDGAAKNPDLARKLGVDVKDPEAVAAKAAEFKQRKAALTAKELSPETRNEIRARAGLAPEPIAAAESVPEAPDDTNTLDLFGNDPIPEAPPGDPGKGDETTPPLFVERVDPPSESIGNAMKSMKLSGVSYINGLRYSVKQRFNDHFYLEVTKNGDRESLPGEYETIEQAQDAFAVEIGAKPRPEVPTLVPADEMPFNLVPETQADPARLEAEKSAAAETARRAADLEARAQELPGTEEARAAVRPAAPKINHELATEILEQSVYPGGDENLALRQRILETLTGQKVTKAKATPSAVRDAIYRELIPGMEGTPFAKQRAAEAKLNEIVNAPVAFARETPTPKKPRVQGSPAPQGDLQGRPNTGKHQKDIDYALDRAGVDTTTLRRVTAALHNIIEVASGIPGLSPIRSGRVRKRRSLGQYDTHSKVIRIWDGLQIGVSAHEVGHALADVIFHNSSLKGVKLDPAVARELHQLGKNLYGNTRPNGGYISEGWAEFVSKDLIGNDMAKLAPATTKWVRDLMDGYTKSASPNLRALPDAYAAARAEATIWRLQGSRARLEGNTEKHKGSFGRLVDQFKSEIDPQEFVRTWFEAGEPLRQMTMAAEKATGRKLKFREDPYRLFKLRRGTPSAILDFFVTDAVTDLYATKYTCPGLMELLTPVTAGINRSNPLAVEKATTDFWAYKHAKRAVERWGQTKNPGVSLDDATKVYRDLDSPHFQRASAGFDRWVAAIRAYFAESSPAARQMIEIIEAGSFDWVALGRAVADDTFKAHVKRNGNAFPKKMKGSDLPVLSVDTQTFVTLETMIAAAHKESILEAVFQLSRHPGLGHWVEEIPVEKAKSMVAVGKIRKQLEDGGADLSNFSDDSLLIFWDPSDAPTDKPILPRRIPVTRKDAATGQYVKGWEMRWYEINPAAHQSLVGLAPLSLSPFMDVMLGVPKRMETMGFTGLRPAFQLYTNLIRDPQSYMIQTHGSSNPLRIVGNLFAGYADLTAAALHGSPKALKMIDDISKMAGLAPQSHRFKPAPHVDIIRALGVMGATRLGGDVVHATQMSHKAIAGPGALGKAITIYTAATSELTGQQRLVTKAANVTFSAATGMLNEVREILSASEKAPRFAEVRQRMKRFGYKPGLADDNLAMGEGFRDATVDFPGRGAGQWERNLSQVTSFWSASKQSMRRRAVAWKERPVHVLLYQSALIGLAIGAWYAIKDEPWFRALSRRERQGYIYIDQDEYNAAAIPLDVEGSAIAGAFVGALDAAYVKDPDEFYKAMGTSLERLSPPVLPTSVKIGWEQGTNRTGFGSPIVPFAEEQELAGAQAGARTSATARALGEAFPETLSPRRLDHVLRSLTGGLGPEAMAAFEKMVGASTYEAPDRWWWERPGGKFARSSNVGEFYELTQKWVSWKNSIDKGYPMTEADKAFTIQLDKHRKEISAASRDAETTKDPATRLIIYRAMDTRAKMLLDEAKKRNKLDPNPVKAAKP